jgi:hypothetical protein
MSGKQDRGDDPHRPRLALSTVVVPPYSVLQVDLVPFWPPALTFDGANLRVAEQRFGGDR